MKMFKQETKYIYLPRLLSGEFIERLYKIKKEKEETVVMIVLSYKDGKYRFLGEWTELNKDDLTEHYMVYNEAVKLYHEYFV